MARLNKFLFSQQAYTAFTYPLSFTFFEDFETYDPDDVINELDDGSDGRWTNADSDFVNVSYFAEDATYTAISETGGDVVGVFATSNLTTEGRHLVVSTGSAVEDFDAQMIIKHISDTTHVNPIQVGFTGRDDGNPFSTASCLLFKVIRSGLAQATLQIDERVSGSNTTLVNQTGVGYLRTNRYMVYVTLSGSTATLRMVGVDDSVDETVSTSSVSLTSGSIGVWHRATNNAFARVLVDDIGFNVND